MLLKEADYDVRLKELQGYQIEFKEDPLSDGILGFNPQIAKLQAHINRIHVMLIESLRNRDSYKMVMDTEEMKHQNELNKLLATDEGVRGEKSEALRKAAAETKASEILMKAHWAIQDFNLAQSYYNAVHQIYRNACLNLDSVIAQRDVVQMAMYNGEIKHGSNKMRVGNETTAS